MILENTELTGSLQVSGSIIVPAGGNADRINITGSLFFNTQSNTLEIYTGVSGSDWDDVFASTTPTSSGGGGAASNEVEYLVVAGGGGGGASGAGSGGGGAGGLLSSSFSSLTSGSTYTITVGAGGNGGVGSNYGNGGSDGGDSSISGTGITTVTTTGGGGGSSGASGVTGRDGGSGGGGNGGYATAGGSGTTGQGNDGGAGGLDTDYGGGGGGGASEVGADNGPSAGGNGGSGSYSSITGTSTAYAGGGGGGARNASSTAGTGGPGGGSDGINGGGDASHATSNTGGGGGGGGQNSPASDGGNGGSGVVILAYDSGSVHGAGGISGDAGNSRRYHQFNSSDSFVMGAVGDFDIVTDDLIAHYDAGDFDSRGTSTWSSLTGSYDSTVNGATLGANFYYSFDGTNDYIQNSTLTDHFSAVQDFTVEAWFQTSHTGTDGRAIFSFSDNTAGSTEMACQVRSNQVQCFNRINGSHSAGPNFYAGSSIGNGSWHHLVYQGDSNGTKIYIDNVEITSRTYYDSTNVNDVVSFAGMNVFTIGANDDSGAALESYFDDKIAQVRVYSKVLTADEISQNYNATKTNFV